MLRPVRALAGAVREVSATRDLNQRIPVSGRDELASLAADFNTMLAALDESQQAQQQLIADASHELRTPLTAHRANIELLARPDLPVERRQRVLGAAVRGIEELSALVGDLIQAAREGRSVDAREPLALDELVVGGGHAGAAPGAAGLRFESRLKPHRLVGARSRLERAIDNVLDNAIKWSPPGGTVDVAPRRRDPDGARPRARHPRRRSAARLRPLLPRRRGSRPARLGARARDRQADRRRPRRQRHRRNADGGGALVTLRFDAGSL